jgi:1-aminocyclopropane-1-carboxylate deaminase/D-cysteine desulfhydrase-like pyridoxal-dependent ACC family enzyme
MQPNAGRFPFEIACMKAGDAYCLPREAFRTIVNHVATSGGMSTDTVYARAAHRTR